MNSREIPSNIPAEWKAFQCQGGKKRPRIRRKFRLTQRDLRQMVWSDRSGSSSLATPSGPLFGRRGGKNGSDPSVNCAQANAKPCGCVCIARSVRVSQGGPVGGDGATEVFSNLGLSNGSTGIGSRNPSRKRVSRPLFSRAAPHKKDEKSLIRADSFLGPLRPPL